MGCGTSFVKYVLFFFNLLFALCGLLILGIGVALKLNITEFTKLLDEKMSMAPILCIVLGSIIFIISFFGCCGAVRESHCMIVTYAIMMIVIIILQVVIAVLIFVYIGDVGKAVTELLNKAFQEYGHNQLVTEAFDALQSQLHCCGLTGPVNHGLTVPLSCCPSGDVIADNLKTCTVVSAYSDGCIKVLTGYMEITGKTAGGVVIGVAVVEAIGAVFALCLANSIKNAERRYR